MQVIDVPVFNEDGSVQFTQRVTPNEAQALLQFALNVLTAEGFAQVVANTRQELDD